MFEAFTGLTIEINFQLISIPVVFQKTIVRTTQLQDNWQHNTTLPCVSSHPSIPHLPVSISLAQRCHSVTYSLAGHHSPTFRSAL